MYNFTKTFVLKDLFKTFDDFCEIRDMYIIEPVEATDSEQEKIYNLILNNFCNCSIAFDTPNAFYRMFFIEYWNTCDLFLKRLSLVKQLRNLTLDELKKEIETISNVANNDNTIVTNPLSEIIPYITSQSSSIGKTNSAVAIERGLSLFRDNEVNNFLNKYKKFFLTVHGNSVIMYI